MQCPAARVRYDRVEIEKNEIHNENVISCSFLSVKFILFVGIKLITFRFVHWISLKFISPFFSFFMSPSFLCSPTLPYILNLPPESFNILAVSWENKKKKCTQGKGKSFSNKTNEIKCHDKLFITMLYSFSIFHVRSFLFFVIFFPPFIHCIYIAILTLFSFFSVFPRLKFDKKVNKPTEKPPHKRGVRT